MALLYGIPIEYQEDNWPWSAREHLDGDAVDRLQPPDLDRSPAFAELMEQVDWIERETGTVRGYLNWQGVLNSAYRIRGEDRSWRWCASRTASTTCCPASPPR